ncbi:hypothetical protein [Paenibacillus elgii]|uniref:hypothetical protein n=1 Tax=Paenibacillus elgii TaxID=189691 RepID=UPI00203C9113|nr:hypothetical protein [Paenibacillus elgii]MCM3271647.1 hypothetical protein [Paenibacillus elgii]
MAASRKILAAIGALTLWLSNAQSAAYAQTTADANAVEVNLPTYEVKVDGKTIDNSNLMYPIINYHAITYFPLTWDVGKSLGLEISWSEESGLSIESHKPKQTELSMEGGQPNSQGTYQAHIARFPVTIDGTTVNNEKDSAHPMLVFRGVTYLPMTAHFTEGIVGWKTTWGRSGYSIYTGLVLDRILFDDDQYLYAFTFYNGEQGRIVKLRKDFEGKAEFLTVEERARIIEASDALKLPPSLESKSTVVKDGSVYYEGVELLNAAAHRSEHPELYDSKPATGDATLEYSEKTVKGPAGLAVVNLALRTARANVPNDPDTHTYLVKDGKALELKSFNKTIHAFKQGDNGLWLWSYAPTSTSVRSSGQYGLVMWIDDKGSIRLWNDVLQSGQLQVLRAEPEEFVVQAFGSPGAYYSYRKIAEAVTDASGYVDHEGVLYELPGNDQVTNLTKGISHRFEP